MPTTQVLEQNRCHFLQVKENHERMQQERDSKRKQSQARKEAEAQARLVVLKVRLSPLRVTKRRFSSAGRTRTSSESKARRRDDRTARCWNSQRNARKTCSRRRASQTVRSHRSWSSWTIDEHFSRSTREYDNAKSERTKAEHERARKEEELHKLKEIALKEQHDLNEKRLHTLVDDFIRMKALTVRQTHLSSHYLISNLHLDLTKTLLCLAECCPRTTLTDGSSSSLSRLETTLPVSFLPTWSLCLSD